MKVKSLILSDLHLGASQNNAKFALEILNSYEYDNLYLLGDILDISAMSKAYHWSEYDDNVWRKINETFTKIKTRYIIGNHERDFPVDSYSYKYYFDSKPFYFVGKMFRDKNFLAIHGHEFDLELAEKKFPFPLGDYFNGGYGKEMLDNLCRNIRRSPEYTDLFAQKAIDILSSTLGFGTIICGHTHYQDYQEKGNVKYYNVGDMKTGKNFMLEHLDGTLEQM